MSDILYFVSDIHAGTEGNQKGESEFRDFLASLENQSAELFIVGDLFDFWFEWYQVIPKRYFDLLYSLRRLVLSGVKVHFVPGNHDFAPGAFLKESLGIVCHSDPYEFEHRNRTFYLSHGDGLAPSDRGYRVLKRVLRSRWANFLFRTLVSGDLGMKIADMSSRSSRKYQRGRRSSWTGIYADEAEKIARSRNADFVVLGHLHEPGVFFGEKSVYLNCGDWINHFSFGCFAGGCMELKFWNRQ